jgi:glycine/D-amino acid oxidase-like deaminating enzyme
VVYTTPVKDAAALVGIAESEYTKWGKARRALYAGLRPGTPDRRPILGADPALSGLFHATGHYRSGILLAPATAEAIADLLLTGRTALPLGGMAPGRFSRGRSRPG